MHCAFLPARTWGWWVAAATALLAFAGCATLDETAGPTGPATHDRAPVPENFFDLIQRSADFELISEAARELTPEKVKAALDAGAELEARNDDGWTPLMWAATYNWNENPEHLEVVQALLDAGADLEARSDDGSTPLMAAVGNNANLEFVQVLLDAGADIEAGNYHEYGWTPFMVAAMWNEDPEVVQALLDAGADIGARDVGGRTALMWAAAWNANPEVMQALLDAGADTTAKDADGSTAWDLIQENEALKGTDVYQRLNELSAE